MTPKTTPPLFAGENQVFSRYLFSLDWRLIRMRPKGDLQDLVALGPIMSGSFSE